MPLGARLAAVPLLIELTRDVPRFDGDLFHLANELSDAIESQARLAMQAGRVGKSGQTHRRTRNPSARPRREWVGS